MTDYPAITSQPQNRHKHWLVFLFALCTAVGAAYLAWQQLDSIEKSAPFPGAAVQPLPQQALTPAPIAPNFDAVSADDIGMLVAAGKAAPDAGVLLQNGEQTLGETMADGHGEWLLLLEHPLPPGEYNLSLLSVLPKTQERVPGLHTYALTIAPRSTATPAPSQSLAAAKPEPSGAPASGKVAAVKRGDTLWAMAHRFYGKGILYGEIAGANKGQIKNPNLIYPNQQLAIPESKEP